MKNKEFKKGIAIGVAATLVVTGAVFTSYQKVLFPKGNALSDVKTVQKLNYLKKTKAACVRGFMLACLPA